MMVTENEIREAERAVIEAALVDADVIDEEGHGALARAAKALKALQSPLPTREELCGRHEQLTSMVKGGRRVHLSYDEIAAWHWADCLRWVAEKSGHCEEPGELTVSGPWGEGCFYCWITNAARVLEARE